jgi:Xaa-Pro dipeptidase
VLDAAGYQAHRMNATGYSLGTTFAPNWMDWPMFYHGNPEPATIGMLGIGLLVMAGLRRRRQAA